MEESNAQLGSGVACDLRRFRLTRVAVAVAACSLLGAGAAQAAIILDSSGTNEPTNNVLLTATPGAVGDEFRGCVGFQCFPPPNGNVNDADFVGYPGLISAATYRLTVGRVDIPLTAFTGEPVTFDLYRNLSLVTNPGDNHTLSVGTFDFDGLTGLTNLKVGVHLLDGTASCCEGYSVRLVLTAGPAASVPEPASAALIAAGLVTAFVARRRKRS